MSHVAESLDAAWALAIGERMGQLIERTHSSWWAPLPMPARHARVEAWHTRWLEVPLPHANLRLHPVNGLALLPTLTVRRLLVGRALLWRRRAVWRAVTPLARQRLTELIGGAGYDALMRDTRSLDAGLATDEYLPADDVLAWEGLCWLRHDGLLEDVACFRLLRLEFPQDAEALDMGSARSGVAGQWWRMQIQRMATDLPTWWYGCVVAPAPASV